MQTLGDLAILVRSKNAGPFWLTLDVMFENRAVYDRVKASKALNVAAIAARFNQPTDQIIVVHLDDALAIKVSFPRPTSSGARDDSDIFGGQQYAPLLSIAIPD
jgi:hypothetical protein